MNQEIEKFQKLNHNTNDISFFKVLFNYIWYYILLQNGINDYSNIYNFTLRIVKGTFN